MFRHILLSCLALGLAGAAASAHPAVMPTRDLITEEVVQEIRDFIERPVVWKSLAAQNAAPEATDGASIARLDRQWIAERESDDQPLIASVLSHPLSNYLTRIQSDSLGLYTEIFVMAANGLNVGQSAITSDYWQGDEAKFQRTFQVGPDAVFIDAAEYHEDSGTWRAQVNMTIVEAGSNTPIGAVTCEINLTELARRKALGLAM